MLISLNVKNLALIRQSELLFGRGLNIITGETGAGKSLMTGSVNLALGKRADADIIRNGEKEAEVELVFSVDDEETRKALNELDIPVSEDDPVILRRTIRDGRSIAKINQRTVTASVLKAVSELLIDIHGQHEHQSLLYKKNHLKILDSFAKQGLCDILPLIREDHNRLLEIKRELAKTPLDERERARQIDLLKFEVEEIEKAGLKEGEDEEIEAAYRRMKNTSRIVSSISRALGAVSVSESQNAVSLVGSAISALKESEGLDDRTDDLIDQLSQIESLLGDFSIGADEALRSLDYSEEQFDETEKRLDLINHLKSKYGDTIEAMEKSLEEKRAELERLELTDEIRQKLFEEEDAVKERLLKNCKKAGDIRRAEAEKLSALMEDALLDLNFNDVSFKIEVREDPENITEKGYDEVEFMISLNRGEKLKGLESVASGGELSRIMLALRTVFADEDGIDTLIFDEIDTGISGRTAQKVAEKMRLLSKRRQVICITHLPQIAAMADHHFLIRKDSDDESTETTVREIEGDEIIDELSRLLSGAEITDAVRQNAAEMKKLAMQV